MTSQDKWFPDVLTISGELDPQEIFNSTRLSWESIYSMQSDVGGLIKRVGELLIVDEDRISKERQEGDVSFVLNPKRNRLPYLNRALHLDARKAPEYNPDTEALTIAGAITGRSTLAISGATTLSSTLAVTGATTLSSTLGVTGTTTTVGRIKTPTRATTTYTILVTDSVVFGNTDGSAWTATLPAGVSGQTFKIINSGSSGNILTVTPNGSEHLLGENSSFNLFDGETLDLTYDTTDGWY